MMWLEVIHLRSMQKDADKLSDFITLVMDEVKKEEGLSKVQLFRRASLEEDVCFQLHHDSEDLELPGSRFGIHLADMLKSFGMVNHTLWLLNETVET